MATGAPGDSANHGDRLEVGALRPDEHGALFTLFEDVVARGEGFPHSAPLTPEAYHATWVAPVTAVVAARRHGTLVGAYFLKPNFPGRAAHIANAGYVVAPRERRRGVGRVLVEDSLHRAPTLGFRAIQFNLVFATNPARSLYEALGWKEIGRLPDAVEGEEALIYWRPVGSGRPAPVDGARAAQVAQVAQVATRSATYTVTRRGDGRPVLLCPALGRPASDFDPLVERLVGSGYQTISLDPPGIHTPLDDPDWTTLHDIAGELWEVVDLLGLGGIVLIGHAFGNRVVRAASTLRPDDVEAMVLLACGGEVAPSEDASDFFLALLDDRSDRALRREAIAKAFFAPGNDPSLWLDGTNPALVAAQGAAAMATSFQEFGGGGSAPALVVQGLDDKVAVPQNAWRLVARRPRTRVLGLPDCGHAILSEQPVAVGDAVVAFLDEVLGPSRRA